MLLQVMPAWSVALDTHRRRQELLWGEIGGITGILGRAARPPSSTQSLAKNEAARCRSLATNSARPRERRARERSSSEGPRQEVLSREHFLNHTLWWDNRQRSRSPHFRQNESNAVQWVDPQLAALDMQMGSRATTFNSSLSDYPDPRSHAGYPRGLTVETVIKLCEHGQLNDAVEALGILVQSGCPISKSLFYSVLKKCVGKKDLVLGRRVHSLTVKMGYDSDTFLCNHILRMYASNARLQEAMDVFTVVAKPDAFMWSSIISAHVRHGQAKRAIQLYIQMRSSTVQPDGHVFVAALKACASGADLKCGQQVHADVLSSGVEPDMFVCNCLVDMYAKCGSLEDSQRVFDKLSRKNVVTWTTIIAAYSQQGRGQEALRLYSAMQQEGIAAPNSVTFVCLLQACASVGILAIEEGRRLHAQIEQRGLQADGAVGGSLVNMYAKCGSLEDAIKLFNGISEKTVVTWNTMIAGYAQQGMGQEALTLHNRMKQEDLTAPDSVTFVCLLQACASVGMTAMEKGKQLHAEIEVRGLQGDVVVGCSLVNMYTKCGSVEDARSVFDELCQKDVVTWNAMIVGYAQRGMGEEALHLYSAMQQEGIVAPDSVTFASILQACASVGMMAMDTGKQVHAHIEECGLQADIVIGCSLVNMYAKCGSLEDAQTVFDRLRQKDGVTWTSMIAGYSQLGMGQEALCLYEKMQQEGISAPNSVTFVCLLQACANVGSTVIEMGKQLHAQIEERGLQADVVVGCSLVNMYAKCGSLDDAQIVFDRLEEKDVVTWNSMIAGYSQQGMGQEALTIYSRMQQEGITAPDSMTFVYLLQACPSLGITAAEQGKQFHAQIGQRGLQSDVVVSCSLVNMYAKCGSLEDARIVFEGVDEKDVVTWNAMIAGYSQQGKHQEALSLYSRMQEECMSAPDSATFVCLLQACASVGIMGMGKGKQLHAQIEQQGLQADVLVANSLINMYAQCGSLQDAQSIFDGLPKKDVVSWTSMIAGYSQQGMGQEALCLYSDMQQEGVSVPDSVTFVCLLHACASVGLTAVEKGKQLHVQIEEQGLLSDVFVANSLINMYAKCASLEVAQSVFDGLGKRDLVTWNAMISGYSQQGMGQEALRVYNGMVEEGIAVPDAMTYVSLLQACASVGLTALEKGKQLHARIEEQGLQADVFVANSLINMYAKCGSLEDAQSLFDGLSQKDVVTWNAMISGYAEQALGLEALSLYSDMKQEAMTAPDSVTFVCLLQACANVAALQPGRHLHAQIQEQGLQGDGFVASSLINMYAKSGSMVEAQQVFDALIEKDIVAWNALIAGYTRQGDSEVVFDLVHRMREDCIQPNNITFLSVLTVCSHAGLVTKGREYFEAMSIHHGITPTVEHYTCMVDLLGRAGQFDEALAVVRTMPLQPNGPLWHTLLGACRKWNNVEVGRYAFDEAVRLDRKDAAAYVMMSSIYTGAQMWEEAQEMQARRIKIGAWKQPGQSWWTDMGGILHTFVVGGESIQRVTVDLQS